MTHERNIQLDIAKGLGMTIVVLFHAQILSGVWIQFHMPLFAFLSGLLYREKYNTELNRVWNYTKKKIKGCYVPFLIYNFAFLMLHNLLYKIHIYGELSNQKILQWKRFCASNRRNYDDGRWRESSGTDVVFDCDAGIYDFIRLHSLWHK